MFAEKSLIYWIVMLFDSVSWVILISQILVIIPADTDVFKTSSGCLKKVTTSHDQTRRCQDVWKKTSDLQRPEDVLFALS